MAPVWMTMLKTFQRSSFASSRSPARMRWPVLEIGRNSVSPSTMPRMTALIRMARSIFSLLSKKLGYCRPESWHAVRTIVACPGQQQPAFRPGPGFIQPPGVLRRNDFVLLGRDAKKRRSDLRRELDRVEAVFEHQVDRHVPVIALG